MEIRSCTSADKAQVVTLWNEVFEQPTGHNDPAFSFDRKLHADDSLLFVATDDGVIIGTVMAGYDGHRGCIYSVAVHPRQRRRGIGTRLMRHAEDVLAKLGCPKINLQIVASNSEVVPFYESLSYRTEPRISMGKLIPQHGAANGDRQA